MKKSDFLLPKDQIYMCGHSLGPMPKLAQLQVDHVLQAWGRCGVKAWNTDDWIDLPFQIAAKIAPFIGCDANDVVVADSTCVNLFKVLMGALKINHQRKLLLTTHDNFPADQYIAQGIQACVPSITLKTVSQESLLSHLNEQVAVLLLTHVNYRDATTFDLNHITAMAHQQGIITVWDLSHSTGALPLAIQQSEADFAVGCTYKYLNAGPGAPAFIYSHKRHHDALISPIYGWMGHENPFAFNPDFQSQGVAQFIAGTPYILSLAALDGALESIAGLDLYALRAQSLKYSKLLIQALQAIGLEVLTPLNETRAGHVAFVHPNGLQLARALIDSGIIVDYRNPGLIRMCVNPLYLTFDEIQQCIHTLQHILDTKLYHAPQYQQTSKVT